MRSETTIVALAMALSLVGCGGIGEAGGEGPTDVADAPVLTADGDALAPEVFGFSGEALWDGRPSLGGVWVAHPDAPAPGRVLIRHEASGEEVTGALFRREGGSAGPPLQVSSDAAEALGLVAGRPATLSVTALVRPDADAPDAEMGAEPGGAEAEGAMGDAAAVPDPAIVPPDA